ncbi:MAG: hypothetical protein ABW140_13305 [Candidatus Sedimenticola sp. 6PFRAG1]
MNEELITQIALQIVNEEILQNGYFYLILMAVMLVATTASSFLTSNLSKRGENYATKQDFEGILGQLKQSTKATEQIRQQITAEFSHEQERRILLRSKLEEVIELTYDLELWMSRARSGALVGEAFEYRESPLHKAEMLLLLYFDNSLNDFSAIKETSHKLLEWMLELSREHYRVKHEGGEFSSGVDTFTEYHPPFIEALNAFRVKVVEENRARLKL